MGRSTLAYQFTADDGNPYITDAGKEKSVSSKIAYGENGLSRAEALGIIGLLGGTAFDEGEKPDPCENTAKGSKFDPRQLTFRYKTDGIEPKRLTVSVPERDDIIDIAVAVEAALDGAGFDVDCISLKGESIKNIWYDYADAPPAQTATDIFDAYRYSGLMNYRADAGKGVTAFGAPEHHRFSVASDSNVAFPAPLATVMESAMDVLDIGISCRVDFGKREMRHAVVKSLVSDTNAGGDAIPRRQSTKVYIGSHLAADIDVILGLFTALPFILCVSYKGESFSGINRLI